MNHNKLLVVFPDGVGIRNYLYSGVLDDFSKEICLFHNFTSETISYLKKLGKIEDDLLIPDYKETVNEKFIRELIVLARLRNNIKITGNESLMENWKPNRQKLSNAIFYRAVEAVAKFYKDYKSILKLELRYNKLIRQNEFYHAVKKILIKINPQLVFCSHQRAMKMATIFAAAHDLKIPTSTVIYSWDNLPKAKLALRSDQYLVWSNYMKEEFHLFYPEIPTESIVVSGTPQFTFYADPKYIIEKTDFYKKYQLDISKKTICFSGDDERTSPDDHQYLEDVLDAITKNGLSDQYQILLRRCPIDLTGRHNKVIQKYPNLVKEAPPLWKFENTKSWTEIYPLYDDVALLVSTAFYCDVVINIGSTMAFDFAMFNKPCLFINYDQDVQVDSEWSVDQVYRFQHFRSMESFDAVGWIDSKEMIVPLIQKAIDSPESVGRERNLWLDKVVQHPSKSAFTTMLNNIQRG